jgi:uncharacterized membrane protein
VGGTHLDTDLPELETRGLVRFVVVLVVLLCASATAWGVFQLWPQPEDEPEHLELLADGVTLVTASVRSSEPPCPTLGAIDEPPKDCGTVAVVVDGVEATVSVPPDVSLVELGPGDELRLLAIPTAEGSTTYSFYGIHRGRSLAALALAFLAVVALVAWWRGLLSLLSLGFAGLVLLGFMVPAILQGRDGTLVTLVGCSAIMIVVLYLTHGVSMRTSAALLGTLGGICLTTVLGVWSVGSSRLTGVSDDSGHLMLSYAPDLSYQGLLTAGLILAGLGILNDVTITQSSSVWELRAASHLMSRWQLFTSAMRIGRDHIASSIYTLVFAYAGTSLATLMLLQLYDVGWGDLLTNEAIVEEIVRTLTASIGLILAVPLTTIIAAWLVPGSPQSAAKDAAELAA